MNEVVSVVETFKTIEQCERTDTLDAIDLGNAMLETKQLSPGFSPDNEVVFGRF